jgi:hypothetical protein
MKIFILTILVSFALLSCGQEKADPIDKDTETVESNVPTSEYHQPEALADQPSQKIAVESMQINDDVEEDNPMEAALSDDMIKTFSPDVLRTYIPATLPNAETMGGSGGSQPVGNVVHTSGKMEYRFTESSGYMGITIFDFGGKSSFPQDELDIFSNPPEYPAKVTSDIELDGVKGYKQWHFKSRSGKVHLKIDDRFSIVIECVRLPKDAGELEDFYKLLKIKQLLKDAKK